ILSVLGCVTGWVVWAIAVNIRRSRTSKHVLDLHGRLLDRFGTGQELTAFLEGEAGKRFFESLTCDEHASIGRVLNSIQAGIVTLLFGVALLVVRPFQDDPSIRQVLLF